VRYISIDQVKSDEAQDAGTTAHRQQDIRIAKEPLKQTTTRAENIHE
jgi:hypothetical protein